MTERLFLEKCAAILKKAKLKYQDKIEAQYSRRDLGAACHGIKNMASINQHAETRKAIIVNGAANFDLPDTFNSFFSCFESSDLSENISACRMYFRDLLVKLRFPKNGSKPD